MNHLEEQHISGSSVFGKGKERMSEQERQKTGGTGNKTIVSALREQEYLLEEMNENIRRIETYVKLFYNLTKITLIVLGILIALGIIGFFVFTVFTGFRC